MDERKPVSLSDMLQSISKETDISDFMADMRGRAINSMNFEEIIGEVESRFSNLKLSTEQNKIYLEKLIEERAIRIEELRSDRNAGAVIHPGLLRQLEQDNSLSEQAKMTIAYLILMLDLLNENRKQLVLALSIGYKSSWKIDLTEHFCSDLDLLSKQIKDIKKEYQPDQKHGRLND